MANFEITPERRDEILLAVVQKIEKYDLITPTLFFLQMGKPLSFVTGQALFAVAPFGSLFVKEQLLEELSHLLSDRENVERLMTMLETRDIERRAKK
ncbi:MAG: hypothetical protein KGZ50_02490 [Peptococcaceae bacterium]|nr:hypothetical protein [Peptococcaceae bacterium]